MTIFDEATAVRRVSDGRYDAYPDQRFAIVAPGSSTPPAVNGGVMIATVLRAVLDSSPLPHPVATSAHFLRVARLEPAEIHVTWLKTGRTAATARATVVQAGQPILETTVTTGTVPPSRPAMSAAAAGTVDETDGYAAGENIAGAGPVGRELSWTDTPPVLPPPEDCVELGPWPGTVGSDGTAGYGAQVMQLFDPAVVGWRYGEPAGLPEMRAYFGLREERDPDALMLALAVDGLPPVVFGLGATGWAPTVELTMYMRLVPAPGLLRVAARCRHVSGGWFDEEAEVWDTAGNLVAQSRQIARVGRGPVRDKAAPVSAG
jgi:acyl-coenzyme A thioesterase PaaI-like protein